MSDDKKAKKDDKPKEDAKDAEKKDGAEGAPAEGAEGSEDPAVQKKKKIKKIILFVVLPIVLLIALGAGAYFMGLFDKFLPPKELHCENVKEGDKDFAACSAKQLEEKDAAVPGAFLDIPNMIVNLSSTGKQVRFLKITIKVELENAEELKKLEPLMPRIVDQFQMYLRELRTEDLRGTSGIYRMKIELLSRVRAAAPNVKIRDVLFQEILVQ